MPNLVPLGANTSTSDQVYLRLKEAITSTALHPGESLVEAEVARTLGVSTTPVREALQRLGQDGLVTLHRFRGATVIELADADIQEIYELRQVLEPLAAQSAVPLLTHVDLAAMREAIDQAAVAIGEGDWRELSKWNRRFHAAFIERCSNHRLRRSLATLQDQNRIIALLTWEGRGYDAQEHAEHEWILDAAMAGHAEQTADRLRRHIARFGAVVTDIWAGQAAHLARELTVR